MTGGGAHSPQWGWLLLWVHFPPRMACQEALPFSSGPPTAQSYELVDSREGRRAWIRTGFPSGLTGHLKLAVLADADKSHQLYYSHYFTSCSQQLFKRRKPLQMKRGCLFSRPSHGGCHTWPEIHTVLFPGEARCSSPRGVLGPAASATPALFKRQVLRRAPDQNQKL